MLQRCARGKRNAGLQNIEALHRTIKRCKVDPLAISVECEVCLCVTN